MKQFALALLFSVSGVAFGMGCNGARKEQLEKQMDKLTQRLKICKQNIYKLYNRRLVYVYDVRETSGYLSSYVDSNLHNPCEKMRKEWVKLVNELYSDREQK